MRYLSDREGVEIAELTFQIPVSTFGYGPKDVKCKAKGPFLADFVWDAEREEYYCDRLFLKRGMVRLDDVPGFNHLVVAASWWAEEGNISNGAWEYTE